MDRFALQFGLGYVEPARGGGDPRRPGASAIRSTRSPPCVSLDDVAGAAAAAVRQVRVSDEMQALRRRPRARDPHRAPACSSAPARAPRSRSSAPAQALALFDGEEFVTPEHVQEIAVPGHRPPPGARPAGALLRRHRRGRWSRRSSRRSPSPPERCGAFALPELPRLRRPAAPARAPPHAGGPARRRPGSSPPRIVGPNTRLTVAYQAFAFLGRAAARGAALGALRRPPVAHGAAPAAALRHGRRAADLHRARRAIPARARRAGLALLEDLARPAAVVRGVRDARRSPTRRGATGSTGPSAIRAGRGCSRSTGGRAIAERPLPPLPPGGEVEVRLTLTPQRRGRVTLHRRHVAPPRAARPGARAAAAAGARPRCWSCRAATRCRRSTLPGARRYQPGGIALAHVGRRLRGVRCRCATTGRAIRSSASTGARGRAPAGRWCASTRTSSSCATRSCSTRSPPAPTARPSRRRCRWRPRSPARSARRTRCSTCSSSAPRPTASRPGAASATSTGCWRCSPPCGRAATGPSTTLRAPGARAPRRAQRRHLRPARLGRRPRRVSSVGIDLRGARRVPTPACCW